MIDDDKQLAEKKKPTPLAFTRRGVQFQNFDELWRFSGIIVQTEATLKQLFDIHHVDRQGFGPHMTALQNAKDVLLNIFKAILG